MKEKWKKYLKRFFLIGASVFSLWAGGNIFFDLYIWGLDNVKPITMGYLAVALIFIWITMLILADELYRVKNE